MLNTVLINWIKEIFLSQDKSLIGLSRLRENPVPVKEVKEQEVKKNKKDIKISELIKGEIY